MEILGIDIGGSGIKGALVEVERGELVSERHRIPTPRPSTPDAVGDKVAELAAHFRWSGPIGCTFPAPIRGGVALTAANVDKGWIGTDAQRLLREKTGCPVVVINDADAAGIAEIEFGAGKGVKGVVILLTLGTGIGSAIFVDGVLLPNTELGHLELNGKEAERWTSDRTRKKEGLKWAEWAARLTKYMQYVELLFSPDLFIIGGGVSKKHKKFVPSIRTKAPVVPARFLNNAGIIGAAIVASRVAEMA